MVEKDNKQQDRDKILTYLSSHRLCTVDEIKDKSGADTLRIYPILFELATEGMIEITQETGWGAPTEVIFLGLL